MKMLRGISPVVATALLVLIAVAVSVLLYTWVSGTVTSQPTSSPSLEERIKIDAVSIDTTNNVATIYITNLGSTTVSISSAYIIDADSQTVLGKNTTIALSLSRGQSGNVTVPLKQAPQPGHTIIAKVVTTRGVEATYIMVYRGS